MNWKFWKRYKPGKPDPEAMFEELSLAYPGKGKYTDMDRYRDFRQLFMGSVQGKRVLHELYSWGHMFKTSIPGNKQPDRMIWQNEGERNFALKLLAALNAEPSTEKPVKQKSRK